MKKKESKEEKPKLIYKSTLLKRPGWTLKTLEIFDPRVAKEVPNSHYRSGPKSKLYMLTEIESIEKTEEFQNWVEKNQKRIKGAEKAVETKIHNLFELIDQMSVKVRYVGDVLEKAIKTYNRWQEDEFQYFEDLYGDTDFEVRHLNKKSDPDVLERIVVNYIRHKLTNYDRELEKIVGKVGKQFGYKKINQKIYDSIKEAYPEYADECDRQLQYKFGNSKGEDLI